MRVRSEEREREWIAEERCRRGQTYVNILVAFHGRQAAGTRVAEVTASRRAALPKSGLALPLYHYHRAELLGVTEVARPPGLSHRVGSGKVSGHSYIATRRPPPARSLSLSLRRRDPEPTSESRTATTAAASSGSCSALHRERVSDDEEDRRPVRQSLRG